MGERKWTVFKCTLNEMQIWICTKSYIFSSCIMWIILLSNKYRGIMYFFLYQTSQCHIQHFASNSHETPAFNTHISTTAAWANIIIISHVNVKHKFLLKGMKGWKSSMFLWPEKCPITSTFIKYDTNHSKKLISLCSSLTIMNWHF